MKKLSLAILLAVITLAGCTSYAPKGRNHYVKYRVHYPGAAAYVGVSPWIYRKLTDQARQYSRHGIEDYIRRFYEYDEAIKSGNLTDQMAVELLLTT